MRRLRHAAPHLAMLAAAGWLWWASGLIESPASGRISPAAWPRAIIGIMALLCAYEVAMRLFFGKQASARGVVSGLEKAEEEPASAHPRMLYAGMALIAAYVALVPWLGFFIATTLFLFAFPLVGGLRRPLLAATIAGVGGVLLLVAFMRIAYISLPLGEGPFRAVSLALLRLIGVS